MSSILDYCSKWVDPVEFARVCWPWVNLYDRQREMLYSVEFNKITCVQSANMMGKDFVAGILIPKQFVCNPEVRILGTSVTDGQLDVMRTEVMRFVKSSKIPLLKADGGILTINHDGLRKLLPDKSGEDPTSYVKFMTTNKGEALAGHHAEYALAVADEASGLTASVKTYLEGWLKKAFIFGNPHQCQNFWREWCEMCDKEENGGILDDQGMDYLIKRIFLSAEDSPNVKAGRLQEKMGLPIQDIIKGVLSYTEYKYRRKMWDARRQCVGLDAKFYVGKELRLYPPEWLAASHRFAGIHPQTRKGRAIGVDTAEGGDDTAICCVDEYGVLELESWKTSDTSVISGHVLNMAKRWECPTVSICFDRGGGGKQIADRMRADGYPVTTVAFNEAVVLDIKRVRHQVPLRRENREDKTTYKSRRHEMYAILSDAIDPAWLTDFEGKTIPDARLFGVPSPSRGTQYEELVRQMSLMPRDYDENGVLKIPSKRRKSQKEEGGKRELSLEEIMGCSPDELDSLAIAYWRMCNKPPIPIAGAVV